MAPLVSVIIPVYNQEQYLSETIDSILAQTFGNYELILVDDGSKDGTASIMAAYAEKDSRVVAVYQPNRGKPDTLNTAAAGARGKYIAFMDHDDLMLPERLERQMAFLQAHPEVHAVSCQCYFVDAKGKMQGIQRYPMIRTAADCRQLVAGRGIYSGAFTGLTIDKQRFLEAGGLNRSFWPTDDHEFFNRFIDQGHILVTMEDILMKYRVHESATSVSKQRHLFNMVHYTEYCINLRRDKQPYISFEAYQAKQQQESWWKRMNVVRRDYALLYHRTAGMALYTRNYLGFAGYFAAASLLHPGFLYHTIANKLKKAKPASLNVAS